MSKRLRPDAINVHNLHAAARDGWSPSLASICSDIAPTVWTLHDMWSFTGGCYYAVGCTGYRTACDRSCLDCEDHKHLTEASIIEGWRARSAVLANAPSLTAVAPSRWLANEASRGLWKSHRIEVIGNPLRLDVFRPIDRLEARLKLGLPLDGPLVFAAAHYLTAARKQMVLFSKALAHLETKITLALMGRMERNIEWSNVTVKNLGVLDDDDTKALAYSAADLLVHPSKADNLSNVIAESLACGTPVVAFEVGGNPELVQPDRSGWLVSEMTPASLASSIDLALSQVHGGLDLRGSSRQVAVELCDPVAVTDRYLSLFESCVNENNP